MSKQERSKQELLESKIEKNAEKLYEQFRDQMDAFEKSPVAKVKNGLQASDVYALGKQFEQWESYLAMCEEEGNTNLLGKLPNVALDIITASYGVSVLPVIASVQPIEEEQGLIYFKNVRAEDTRGNVTALQKLSDPRTSPFYQTGYASNKIEGEVGDTGDGTEVSFSFTLAALPVRAESLKIRLSAGSAEGVDVGPAPGSATPQVGRIFGSGVSGTVNYITGAVALTFTAAPANLANILADYQQNHELAADIPQIQSYWDHKAIKAHVYALKGTVGMLQSYAMKKRFGMMGEDEMSTDIVAEITKELSSDAIKKLIAGAVSTTSFSRTAPSGVSFFEHKQLYKDSLATAEATLAGNSGRGTINVMVVGRTHAALVSTLPGFQKISDGTQLGPHIYGMLDGVTYIRCIETSLIAADNGVGMWKGLSPFEAPLAYAPYMPLAVTGTLPMANPLMVQKAAAVWAGIETIVPQYSTNFNVTA